MGRIKDAKILSLLIGFLDVVAFALCVPVLCLFLGGSTSLRTVGPLLAALMFCTLSSAVLAALALMGLNRLERADYVEDVSPY